MKTDMKLNHKRILLLALAFISLCAVQSLVALRDAINEKRNNS